MDLTSAGIGGAVATGVFGIFGWVLKRSIAQLDKKLDGHDEAIKEQSKALEAHRLHVAEHYVNHGALEKAIDAFNRSIDAVFAKLDRIEEKLDKKADRV
jgi:predicted  nucleic acid-binding Zn-ribbon protein